MSDIDKVVAVDFDGVIGTPPLGGNIRIGSGEWSSHHLERRKGTPRGPARVFQAVYAHVKYSGRRPLPGVQGGLAMLAERHRVVIVTARPSIMGPRTRRWLMHHGLSEFVSDIVTNESGLPAPVHKLAVARQLKAAAFIEDDGRTARYLGENGIAPVVLIDWPRNRAEYPPYVHVAPNLLVAAEFLCSSLKATT